MNERPSPAPDPSRRARAGLARRDFLRASGVAAGVALLEGCARGPHVGYLEQPVDRNAPIPGVPSFRLGICGQCPAGCGTRVRVVDGEVKKIEGNPDHPVSRGGLCALGQAAPQGIYDPDRITAPMRRDGDAWATVDWEAALGAAAERLAAARERDPGSIAIVAPPDGVVEGLWRRFAAALGGALFVRAEPDDAAVERLAAEIVLGRPALPRYDLSEADHVLTIGADLIDRWRSPVHLARALQDARERDPWLRFDVATPRMSLTAARADLWLPVRPGTEGVLARGLAGALLAAGGVGEGAAERYRRLFPAEPPSLEATAAACGVSEDRVRDAAERLAGARRPVVLGGGSAARSADGVAQVTAILALGMLAGGDRPPIALPPEPGRLAEDGVAPVSMGELARRLAAGQVELLVVADADPLHAAPPRLREAWSHASQVVALGDSWSDTALTSELVLPTQVDLERLVASVPQAGPEQVAVVLGQPVREPLGEARHPGDLVLALAATQDRLAVELPWESFEDYVRDVVAGGSRAAERRAFDAGFWPAEAAVAQEPGPATEPPGEPADSALARGGAVPSVPVLPEPGAAAAAGATEDPSRLRLIPFESVKGDQAMANRPWLQELPDPMSTILWTTWAELAPADAERIGVDTGDRVRLRAEQEELEVAVFVTPAARPGTVAVPVGGGARGRGRWAGGRGANVHLLAAVEVDGAGVAALGEVTVIAEWVSGPRVAVYGRGLRSAEQIPRGWRPHVPKRPEPRPAEPGSEPAGAEVER